MIIFDTETTGLVGPDALALEKQPRIIEFSATKLDDKTLKKKDVVTVLINPGFSLSDEIIRITGLKDADLEGKPPFQGALPQITDFFLGEHIMVAHNCEYDARMMEMELRRIGREFMFPWPPRRICTVETTFHFENRRLKLAELCDKVGVKLVGAHRTANDVEGLAACVKWLIKKGEIVI